MKTGFNLLLWTGHVTEKHFPILADLKKVGYDGVELPLFEGTAAHYQNVRKELDNLGLGCTTVTVLPAPASAISPDAADRTAALDHLKWAIEMTAVLGGDSLVGPYHQPLGQFSGVGPTQAEQERAVEVLRLAAGEAQKAGVRLAIEYLNRFECYFLTTAADARQLVRQVNHPSFGTMYDSFHANIEEKNAAGAIRTLADVMFHVHISENDRGTPGTGHVAWDETFRTLREVGYDGWLTVEAFGRALPALAAATKIWRDLFADPKDVYKHGLAFMKEKWARHGK